jgi:hypothetical protein
MEEFLISIHQSIYDLFNHILVNQRDEIIGAFGINFMKLKEDDAN